MEARSRRGQGSSPLLCIYGADSRLVELCFCRKKVKRHLDINGRTLLLCSLTMATDGRELLMGDLIWESRKYSLNNQPKETVFSLCPLPLYVSPSLRSVTFTLPHLWWSYDNAVCKHVDGRARWIHNTYQGRDALTPLNSKFKIVSYSGKHYPGKVLTRAQF